MSEFLDLSTLITIAIAVFILLRLRSVLGQRTGHQPPPMPRRPQPNGQDAPVEAGSDNVISLSNRGQKEAGENETLVKAINAYAKPGTKLNKGMKAIAEKDPGFEPEGFVNGARMAYEMIVTAFADADRKTLKNLLSKEVYEGFSAAIADREKRDESVRSTFVGIEKAAIKAAEMSGNDAHVTVQFISQIISSTHDSKGELVDGDPNQVAEVNDVWTFARSTRSRDPNWKLVATESDG